MGLSYSIIAPKHKKCKLLLCEFCFILFNELNLCFWVPAEGIWMVHVSSRLSVYQESPELI